MKLDYVVQLSEASTPSGRQLSFSIHGGDSLVLLGGQVVSTFKPVATNKFVKLDCLPK